MLDDGSAQHLVIYEPNLRVGMLETTRQKRGWKKAVLCEERLKESERIQSRMKNASGSGQRVDS